MREMVGQLVSYMVSNNNNNNNNSLIIILRFDSVLLHDSFSIDCSGLVTFGHVTPHRPFLSASSGCFSVGRTV